MNDSSLYLNYPGLKYLNNMESDWDEDSSYYMGYEGLKYLSKKQSNLNNKEKKFLNLDGLQYMLFARMFSVLEDYKRKEDEKEYADDSSIRIEYDEDGGINLICDTNNKLIFCATFQLSAAEISPRETEAKFLPTPLSNFLRSTAKSPASATASGRCSARHGDSRTSRPPDTGRSSYGGQ